jgi:hypothetical protein
MFFIDMLVRDSASLLKWIVYSLVFPAAFARFHLAFADAEIFAFAAALILRLPFLTGFTADFFPLAFPGAYFAVTPFEPKSLINCFSRDWIFPFIVAARSNVLIDRFDIEFIGLNRNKM